MIEFLKYRVNLLRLKKAENNINKEFNRVHKKVINTKFDDGELSYVGQQEEEIKNWISYIQTEYYSSVCQKLLIPMPNSEDSAECFYTFNFDDGYGERHIFTTEGFHAVRKLIREERKARREAIGFWFTILTGLVGALIGLVSMLKGA